MSNQTMPASFVASKLTTVANSLREPSIGTITGSTPRKFTISINSKRCALRIWHGIKSIPLRYGTVGENLPVVSSRMMLTAQKLFHLLRFPSPPSSIHHILESFLLALTITVLTPSPVLVDEKLISTYDGS